MRRAAGLAVLAIALGGCGDDRPAAPPQVEVSAGNQELSLRPTQYCQDGEGRRYRTAPPVVEVSPDTAIRLTVPDAVADRGWSVQVFDEQLETQLGEVEVPEGQTTSINSSDVVPPAFYLVVVEDSGEDCGGLSGAWPVGFLRPDGENAAS